MGDQMPGYTLDDAISTLGFGTFQGLALVFAGIGWFSQGTEINLLSFIGPAVRSEWSLSPTEESLLSTAVFSGMLVGSYFWGFISDYYGRRVGIRGLVVLIAGAGLLSSLSPDYKLLIILRCLVGFGASGLHVLGSWFLEFIPRANRGSWMLSAAVIVIFGELSGASIAWIVIPRLGWRWLLVLSYIPPLLLVIFSGFMPESPRYLFTEGRISEALAILERIALVNKKELPSGFLVSDRSMPLDEENSLEETLLLSSTKKKTILETMTQLFSRDLLRTSILLPIVHFGFSFAFYGIVLMISSLNSKQNLCGTGPNDILLHLKNVQGTSLYRSVLITSSAGFPGYIIATVFVDRLGRKPTMLIASMLTVIGLTPLCFPQNEMITTALLYLARMLISTSLSSLNVYTKEVYPTSVRASGSGMAASAGSIGGMICPLVAVGLVRECHQTYAVILFGIVMLVSGICVWFFPFETKGKRLADTVST